MQTLLALSIALFAGLMMSRVTKKWNLPAVTAYLVAGILIGPFCLGRLGIEGIGFISLENVESFKILSDVALGFIAYAIGGEFKLTYLKKIGKHFDLGTRLRIYDENGFFALAKAVTDTEGERVLRSLRLFRI